MTRLVVVSRRQIALARLAHKIGKTFSEAKTMENANYCQSCGMPISAPHLKGTKADGSPTGEYCTHCYQRGKFVQEMTLDEMIKKCLPHLISSGMAEPEARELLEKTLPTLARWR